MDDQFDLHLHVAGQTPKPLNIPANVQSTRNTCLAGRRHVEIIDHVEQPHCTVMDRIFVFATLAHQPLERITDDLSWTDNGLLGLDIKVRSAA